MASSKRKTILNYVRDTTLSNIKVENSYAQDVEIVERGVRPLDSIADSELPALFVGKTIEKRINLTINQFKGVLSVFVVGFVSAADGDSVQESLDDLIADATHAFESDRTLGGNAKSTEIKNIVTDDGNLAPRAGFVMEVEIFYTTEGVTP